MPPGAQRRTRRSYGKVRRLPSGRYQASHVGPDGHRHLAPSTFDTKGDADAWLAAQRTDIGRGEWQRPAPAKRPVDDFETYAGAWMATRQLTPRTRAEYIKILKGHLLPTFGPVLLEDITPAMVRQWHANLATGPTRKAHAYSLLRTILTTAVADDVIAANPCRIRGASTTRRARTIHPASLAELGAIVEAMPDQYQLAVLLAAWCAMRFGEVAELRRKDIDLTRGRVRIRRAVTYVDKCDVVGEPKTEAGSRDVAIPPHLLPAVKAHLVSHTAPGRDGLLFRSAGGGHLRSGSAMHDCFHAARASVGRPDLTFHDLRHTGAVLAASTGATLAELMARLGHSSPDAAMRYQHASVDRDMAIAVALSQLQTARVVELPTAVLTN
jgi:integrase